jgi:hypothetical protein
MNKEWLDEDGVYPTEAALEKISNWPYEEIPICFEFMKDIWEYSDMGFWEEEETEDHLFQRPVHQYYISTGGWSGNESIIHALEKNWIIWRTTWVQSRRGGHYIFERRT